MNRLLVLCLLGTTVLYAQPPKSSIFLAAYDGAVKELQRLELPEGYNNQPHWMADGNLLFTGIHGERQADIFLYETRTGKLIQKTNTDEAEYSPTVTPDGKHFSTIRVEADGAQRLWRFPLAGGEPELIMAQVKPVGYHLWFDQTRLALFLLGEPHFLGVVDTQQQKVKRLFENVGRCLAIVPGEASFTAVKKEDDRFVLMKYGIETLKGAPLMETLPGSEDYVWTPDGQVIMGKDSALYIRKPGVDDAWKLLVELKGDGLGKISRLALSHDGKRLAIVSE